MKSIASAANPHYKAWLKLAREPRAVRAERRTLAEGAHLVEAALAQGVAIDRGLVRSGPGGAAREPLLARLLAAGVPLVELAAPLFDALALVEHGIGLALVLETPPAGAGALSGDALYLDGVQEPGNVGALLRVAAAAGLRHVLASSATAALWSPKVLRAGQGAHFVLDLREAQPAAALAASHHWIAADAGVGAEPLWTARWPARPVGWVLGSEGQGISAAALAGCRQRVTVPLAAGVESLNVATAAAVCLFERQRRLVS